MPRVAVDVMLKREILDPQGQAVERALPALGFGGVSDVRVGKHVELTVQDGDPQAAARRMVMRIAGTTEHAPVERFVWAVRVASRYLPRTTCLTQALAAQALLASAGHESSIEIGVANDGQGLEAHAWLTCRNQIVIGGPEVTRYARLTG